MRCGAPVLMVEPDPARVERAVVFAEVDHFLVGVAHLQVDFATSALAEESLHFNDQLPGMAAP